MRHPDETRFTVLPLRLAIAACLLFVPAAASTIGETVQQLRTGLPVVVAGEPLCRGEDIARFYDRRHLQRAWDRADAEQLLRAIEAARDEGLTPEHYHQAALAAATGDEREILLTDAFFGLAADLVRGHVDPEVLHAGWCIPPRDADLVAILEAALDEDVVGPMLARLAPRQPAYTGLKEALRHFRGSSDWPAVSPGAPLKIGDTGERVFQLRARLGLEPSADFDEQVDDALRHFQRHHGLTPDGVAGPATQYELNVTREQRIEQILVNLERWRWMPDQLGARHVLVNVAAFELQAVGHDAVALPLRVIVGKDFTRTPFFGAEIRGVVANPYWNVPDSIARDELYPMERRSPGYLRREHIQIMPGGRLRQLPGPWNALGRLKLDMPNRFNVYLHDTPARALFEREIRTFSHGCIRVENPASLAAWLLETPESAIEAAIASGENRTLKLSQPVPVYVQYWTAYVAPDGHIEFRRDVYGRDAALAEALRTNHF